MKRLRVRLSMSDKIPPQEDVPALVALLSEQIADVKTSIEDLKQGLNDGLKHLEIRLDDHAVRLTHLERSEIRREEAERVRAQMVAKWDEAVEGNQQAEHVRLSRTQVRIALTGILLACLSFVVGEIHGILS